MQITPFIITNDVGNRPLQVAVKQYHYQRHTPDNRPGIVLILLHASGYNKEIWEPFLEELESLQITSGRPYIEEAWGFDCPTHGESGILNDQQFAGDIRDLRLEEYARAGLCLLESDLFKNIDKERVIIVGHSMGAMAAAWLASIYHQEKKKLVNSCILVEPLAEIFDEPPVTKQKSKMFLEPTRVRRNIWPSKKEALEWLSDRRPWKGWDRRALEAYVEYGLRPLPTSRYPGQSGVTLSCDRVHECFSYSDFVVPEMSTIAETIPSVCRAVPLHVLVTEKSILRPTDDTCKKIASTPGMSVTRIPKGDHLVVQERPKELALLVFTIVRDTDLRKTRTCRL